MKIEKALDKLGIEYTSGEGIVSIKGFMYENEVLEDNLNLLAKELHMEVEYEALTVKHKLGREKHKEIRVEDTNFLEEENGFERTDKKL